MSDNERERYGLGERERQLEAARRKAEDRRDWVEGQNEALIVERDRAIKALEFYADPASYDAVGPHGTVRGSAWRIVEDDGQIARQALASLSPSSSEGTESKASAGDQ